VQGVVFNNNNNNNNNNISEFVIIYRLPKLQSREPVEKFKD